MSQVSKRLYIIFPHAPKSVMNILSNESSWPSSLSQADRHVVGILFERLWQQSSNNFDYNDWHVKVGALAHFAQLLVVLVLRRACAPNT